MDKTYTREFLLAYKRSFPDPEPDTLAFVEGKTDIFFWEEVFKKYTKNISIEVKSVTIIKDHGGKRELQKIHDKKALCSEIIICVDSDYDYLLKTKWVNETYVFQTYAYSIENYFCIPDILNLLCVQNSTHNPCAFNFNVFIREFSAVIYTLFIYSVYFEELRRRDGNKHLTLKEFMNTIIIDNVMAQNIDDDGKKIINILKAEVNKKIEEFKPLVNENRKLLKQLEEKIHSLRVSNEEIYLLVKGKDFFNKMILPVINRVLKKYFSHNLSHTYLKGCLGDLLKDGLNTSHLNCHLMQKIEEDIVQYEVSAR